MPARRNRLVLTLTSTIALSCLPALAAGQVPGTIGQGAPAQDRTAGHTITYWCTDMNELWHLDVPVVVGVGLLNQQSPCTPTVFPVTVPNGSRFAIGNAFWSTNRAYPQALRAALEQSGYVFHSNSPMEDFLGKLVEVRVEIRTYPGNVLTQELRFNPRQAFGLVQLREYTGLLGTPSVVDPDYGLDVSEEEYGRMPLVGTPVVAGPVPPGQYRMLVFWTLSERHNDGFGMEAGNFLPAGEFQRVLPRFVVMQ